MGYLTLKTMLADIKDIEDATILKKTNDLLLCKFCVPPMNNYPPEGHNGELLMQGSIDRELNDQGFNVM